MRGPVFALTIWQPWAWAIVQGHKKIENRTWRPPRHLMGKWMLIHAGATLDTPAVETVRRIIRYPALPKLTLRHVVGVVRVHSVYGEVDSLSPSQLEADHPGQSRWYAGPFAWFFDQAIEFPQPIPMRGQQGVFRVADVVAAEAREQYALATRRSADDDGQGELDDPKPNSPADVGYAQPPT